MTPFGLGEFTYGFVMKTVNHYYELYSESDWEKEMWINAFYYIIVSNMQAKNLIKQALTDEKIVKEQKKRYHTMVTEIAADEEDEKFKELYLNIDDIPIDSDSIVIPTNSE